VNGNAISATVAVTQQKLIYYIKGFFDLPELLYFSTTFIEEKTKLSEVFYE
jgi:hypothetical protein